LKDTDVQLLRDVSAKDGVTEETAKTWLNRPLTLIGPPEEIDSSLLELLSGFAQSHKSTLESFTELQAALAEAAKAAKEATAKAKAKIPAKTTVNAKIGEKAADKPAPTPVKVATGAAKAPDSFTLWDAADDANAAVAAIHAEEPSAAPPAEDEEGCELTPFEEVDQ
jgi:PRTRC genetic system protein E